MDAETKIEDGTLLIYTQDDGGRITDTGVYLQPGAEHVVLVGKDLSGELAQAFVDRGICAVYTVAPESAENAPQPPAKPEEVATQEEVVVQEEAAPAVIPEPVIIPEPEAITDTPALINTEAINTEAINNEDANSH